MFSKFVPTLFFSQVLFHVFRKQLLSHLRRPFCILWVLVFNYIFFDVLLSQRSKPGSHVFASSLTASNTKRANLTWLPLEIMHRGHTWHDYPWLWVSLTWLLYRRWFWKPLSTFGQSEKRNIVVSWMYNKQSYCTHDCRQFLCSKALQKVNDQSIQQIPMKGMGEVYNWRILLLFDAFFNWSPFRFIRCTQQILKW